jgi:hypothetical protein
MAAHRHARGIAQRRLDPDEEEEAPEPPTPEEYVPIEKPKRVPVEEMPGGSGSALQERQRRWLVERARFEAADKAAREGATAAATVPP